MEQADRAVERRGLDHLVPGHREDVAHQHLLQVLGLLHRLAHRQNRRRGGHRVADADDGLLRDARLVAADGREHRRADEREDQADHVGRRAVRLDPVQRGDGSAERGDLRQREIDEDDPALHHVNAQVGMNACQNQARDKRRQQE